MTAKLANILTDETKWCKNALKRDNKCCLMGAVCKAAKRKNEYLDIYSRKNKNIYKKLAKIIKTLYPNIKVFRQCQTPEASVIASFNDAPETTFDKIKEVVDYYDVHHTHKEK